MAFELCDEQLCYAILAVFYHFLSPQTQMWHSTTINYKKSSLLEILLAQMFLSS